MMDNMFILKRFGGLEVHDNERLKEHYKNKEEVVVQTISSFIFYKLLMVYAVP